MIRILLSLAIAAAAFFGPWIVDSTGNILNDGPSAEAFGSAFADPTIECIKAGTISVSDACAPNFGVLGQLVTYTIILGVVSAILSVVGLLPLIGRLTSVVTIVTGVLAIVTFAWFAKDLMSTEGAVIADFRWGAYATGLFGILTVFAGLAGLRGDQD